MLEELRIRDYALIEDITLKFDGGFTVFTGETGAGKSILIEALGLILGDRVSGSIIRSGADQCSVTGVFSTGRISGFDKLLGELGLGGDEDCVILRREITASGRNRCYVNDRPVNLGTLRNVSERLVDLHGQHEHQSLFKAGEQRELLDQYGRLEQLREDYSSAYRQFRKSAEIYESFNMGEQEKARKLDLLRFQIEEIDAAQLKNGEDEEITSALPRLKNAEKLSREAEQAYDVLYQADGSIRDQLMKLKNRIEAIDRVVGEFGDQIGIIDEMTIQFEELTHRLEEFRSGLDGEPARIDEMLTRLDRIERLKRKYGKTIPEIIEYRGRVGQEYENLEQYDERKESLKDELDTCREKTSVKGRELSALRQKAAREAAAAIQKELRTLGMPGAVFSIAVMRDAGDGEERWNVSGLDRVEFRIAPNPGGTLQPLRQIASGGEISRVMLAIKNVGARTGKIPVLIFDEIDAGIGGAMGTIIGEKMKLLSRRHQVIAITHLPPIASCASVHFRVTKESGKNRTRTVVERLSLEQRRDEIAVMLGGRKVSDIGLKHADEILKGSQP